MKKRIIWAMFGLIAVALVGCSAVTPAPEIVIVGMTPSVVPSDQDSAAITVTFKNINRVDAVITQIQTAYNGPIPPHTLAPGAYKTYFFLPGASDSTILSIKISGLNNTRALIGSPGSCTIRFWGSDAFGYNKAFYDSTYFGF